MTGLEKASELTNGLVMLNGLSMATAKNEEIRDILTQINIETGCYDLVCSPKFWLVKATLETCLQVHMMNQQLRDNPGLLQRMAEGHSSRPEEQKAKKLDEAFPDL